LTVHHRSKASTAAVISCGGGGGAFDLSVTLRHGRSWSVSVSDRYRLTAKNRCIGIGRKWRTLSNTNCRSPFSAHTSNLVKISDRRRIGPKNNIRKTPAGGRILLPVPMSMPSILRGPSYVLPCKISAKSDNWQPSYSNLTILPFRAHFGVPSALTDLRVGGPTPTQLVPWATPTIGPWHVF